MSLQMDGRLLFIAEGEVTGGEDGVDPRCVQTPIEGQTCFGKCAFWVDEPIGVGIRYNETDMGALRRKENGAVKIGDAFRSVYALEETARTAEQMGKSAVRLEVEQVIEERNRIQIFVI